METQSGALDRYQDEDLVEELLRRNGSYTDEQVRTETSRALKEHGGAEAAEEALAVRLSEVVVKLLSEVERQASKCAVLLAVRDELLDQIEVDEEADDPGDEEED